MTNPFWGKRKTDEPIWHGPRVGDWGEMLKWDPESRKKVETILDAMDWPQLIIFRYDGSDRVVAPLVLGMSSVGNGLLRGFQLEGVSKGSVKQGWRVYQLTKMEGLEDFQDFFEAKDLKFDEFYPWEYFVFGTLEGGIP